MYMNNKEKLLSMRDLVGYFPHPLPQSYPALREFVIRHKKEFQPVELGKGNGKRYYFKKKNVDAFIQKFVK